MFSNNYTTIFELLGGNQIFNNFNESTIEETKAEILANIPPFTDAECDESSLEGPLRTRTAALALAFIWPKHKQVCMTPARVKKRFHTRLIPIIDSLSGGGMSCNQPQST